MWAVSGIALPVALGAAATQLLVHGARAVVEGVVGSGAWTDAALVAATLFGVAGGATLGARPRRALVAASVAGGLLTALLASEAAPALLALPHGVRVVVVALLLGALTAPLGALVGGLVRPDRREAYSADLLGSAVGVGVALVASASVGFVALAVVGSVATGLAALLVPPEPMTASVAPTLASPTSRRLGAALVLALVVGVLEPTIPALLAPATAASPFVLGVVVAAVLVGGAVGARVGVADRRLWWPLAGATIVVVVVAMAADPWRDLLLTVLGDHHRPLAPRLAGAVVVIGLPVALVAAASGAVLAGVLDRRTLVATSTVAGLGALAMPVLSQAAPEQVVAGAGLLLGGLVLAVAARRPPIVLVGAASIGLAVGGLVAPARGHGTQDLSRHILLGPTSPPRPGAVVRFDGRDASGRTVVIDDDDTTLFRDGKADASLGGDVETQALLALLPLLYVPTAKEAVVVGLGSGATARWLADAGVDVTAVEISPRVVAASALFGEGPLPPSVRVIVDDARAAFAGGLVADVVTAEPSNAWAGGNQRLVSRQALTAMRDASRSGVVVLWTHTYLASDETIGLLRSTMQVVFDEVDVYDSSTHDVFFVGRPAGLIPDDDGLATRLGRRLPCALGATGLRSTGQLVERARTVTATPGVVHDDLQPRLVPAALLALLHGDMAPLPPAPTSTDDDDDNDEDLVHPAEVVEGLMTPGGRARLREHADRWRIDDGHGDGGFAPWAPPLARAGLALLGDGVRADDAVAALEALAAPRCAPLEVVDVALEVARLSARRAPDAGPRLAAAMLKLPVRHHEVRRRLMAVDDDT